MRVGRWIVRGAVRFVVALVFSGFGAVLGMVAVSLLARIVYGPEWLTAPLPGESAMAERILTATAAVTMAVIGFAVLGIPDEELE